MYTARLGGACSGSSGLLLQGNFRSNANGKPHAPTPGGVAPHQQGVPNLLLKAAARATAQVEKPRRVSSIASVWRFFIA